MNLRGLSKSSALKSIALIAALSFASSAQGADDAVVPPLQRESSAQMSPAVEATPAAADTATKKVPEEKSERRDSIALGFGLGFGLFGASGYPNDLKKIDAADSHVSSGLMTGYGAHFYLMGALADVLNFGFWGGFSNAANDTFTLSMAGGGVRVEAFPLYHVKPWMRDWGISGEFGLGSMKLDPKVPSGGAEGILTYVSVGTFYEFNVAKMLGGHLALAPSAEFQAITSRPADSHGFLLGGRFVFYGGP